MKKFFSSPTGKAVGIVVLVIAGAAIYDRLASPALDKMLGQS